MRGCIVAVRDKMQLQEKQNFTEQMKNSFYLETILVKDEKMMKALDISNATP